MGGGPRYVRGALFALLAAWKLPEIGVAIEPADVPPGFRFLDPSWIVGVNWAFERGLAWGREIVFPFGPLAFLYQNDLVDPALFRLSVVFELAVYGLLVWALHRFTRALALDVRWTAAFVGVLVLLPLPGLDFLGPILLALLLFLVLRRAWDGPPGPGKGRAPGIPWTGVAAVTFLAALLSLIKLSLLVAALGLMILFGGALATVAPGRAGAPGTAPPGCSGSAPRARWRAVAVGATPVAAWLGWLLLLWVAAGQPLGALGDFARNGYEIVSGYSAAMGLVFFHRFTVFGLSSATLLPPLAVALLVVFALLVAHAARRAWATESGGDVPALFLLVALLGVLYLAFKQGFVRFDGHVRGFLSTAPLAALLAVSVTRSGRPDASSPRPPPWDLGVAGLAVLAGAALFAAFPGTSIAPGAVRHADAYGRAGALFLDGEAARAAVESQKRRLLAAYALPDAAALAGTVGDGTVDVLPWDIALLWATGLEWAPRPVFQSYAAYTAHLDALNATSLRDDPPDYLLYRNLAIDGRHPLFTNPMTMRAVVDLYETHADLGGGHLLLRRSPDPARTRLEPLETRAASFGEPIPVPDAGDARVYARIHIRYSFRGRVLETLYRPARIYIRLLYPDGTSSRRYRFVASSAENGILVSTNPDRPGGFGELLEGIDGRPVRAIELTAVEPAHYRPEVTIEFVRGCAGGC